MSKKVALAASVAAGFITAAFCAAQLLSAQGPVQAPGISPELQKRMEAQAKASQPGPQQLNLMRLDGDYVTSEKFYPPGQSKPRESSGTATLHSEMGGRFIVERNSGGYLGEPYTGVRIYGFNNGTKKYEGVWVSTHSTGIISLLGESKDGGMNIEYTGTYYDDATGKLRTMGIALRILDPDHFEVDASWTKPDGTSGARLVSLYTRKELPVGSPVVPGPLGP